MESTRIENDNKSAKEIHNELPSSIGKSDNAVRPQVNDDLASILTSILESEKKAEMRLAEMNSLIMSMMSAIKKQPNLSRTVKDGLPVLAEKLDYLAESRRTSQTARTKLVELAKTAVAGSARPAGSAESISTPSQENKKRVTSSPPLPPEIRNTKKAKEDAGEEGWTQVRNKKRLRGSKKEKVAEKVDATTNAPPSKNTNVKRRRRNRGPPAKLDAIVLRPVEGKTYADVLGTVRKSVDPETCGVEVRSVRRTRTGEVLLEIKKASAGARTTFSDALRKVVGGDGSVRELVPKLTLEIRDLDCCSTRSEVEEAVRGTLQNYGGELRVALIKPNDRGQAAALVTLDEVAGNDLLRRARLRVGWVNCRVRARVAVLRCYKCLGYGHQSSACRGPDRSGRCFRCGAEGHKAAGCAAPPVCFLCPADGGQARGHAAGSGECGVFRAALDQAKKKWRS